jgi:predicted component of type VI protein secretion system
MRAMCTVCCINAAISWRRAIHQPARGAVSDVSEFLYLQLMNRYEPLFAHLSTKPLLHPEQLYATLLELAASSARLRAKAAVRSRIRAIGTTICSAPTRR